VDAAGDAAETAATAAIEIALNIFIVVLPRHRLGRNDATDEGTSRVEPEAISHSG
jgi:hypothetical protein